MEEIIKHRGIIDLAVTIYPPQENAIYVVGRSEDSKPNDRFAMGMSCTIYRLFGQNAKVGSLTVQPNRARRPSNEGRGRKGATYFDAWRRLQDDGNVFANGVVQKLKMYSNTWHSLQHVVPDKPISFGVREGAKAEKMTYGVMQRKWDGIRNALSIFREMHGGLRIEATIDANLLQDIDSPEVCGEGAFEQLHHVMLSAMRHVVNNLDLTLYTLDSGEIPNAFLKFYRRAWSIGLLSGRAGSILGSSGELSQRILPWRIT